MRTPTTKVWATVAAATALTMLAGCRTNSCRDNTVLVALTLRGAAASAESLRVSVSIDGAMPPKMQTVARGSTSGGNLEVQFPNGYPKGKSVWVAVDAVNG